MIKYLIDTPNQIQLECWHEDIKVLFAQIMITEDTAVWSDRFFGNMSKNILKTMKSDFTDFENLLRSRGVTKISILVAQDEFLQGSTLAKIFKFPALTTVYYAVKEL